MKPNKFAYLYSKLLGNHTSKIMKNIPGNLLKNLEKSWKYHGILSVWKSGNPDVDLWGSYAMHSVTTELVQLHFSFSTYSGYFVLRSFYTLLYFALSPWEFLELRLVAGEGGQRRGWFGISGNFTIVSAYPFRRVTQSWTCLDGNKHRNKSCNRWGNYRVKFLHLSFCSQGGVAASVHPGIPPPPTTVTAADGTHPSGTLSCYRPQRSWGKAIFSQASVILSTGGCLVPGGLVETAPPGYCCGRSASYWNAFLLKIKFTSTTAKSTQCGRQGGHGTGKTGNWVLTFSSQGKHREFCSDTGKTLDCDY